MTIPEKDWKEYDEGSWAIRDGDDEIEVRVYEQGGTTEYGWAFRHKGIALERGTMETLLAAQKVAMEMYKKDPNAKINGGV